MIIVYTNITRVPSRVTRFTTSYYCNTYRVFDEIPVGGHFIELVNPDGPTCACKILEEEGIGSSFVALCERRCCGGLSLVYVGWRWTGRPVLLGDGDSMESWCDWWGQLGGWGGVSLDAFEMAAKLPLIKFFTVAVTVFDFVILIEGVKRDYLAFMESSACKPFMDDCTIWENSSVYWEGRVDTL